MSTYYEQLGHRFVVILHFPEIRKRLIKDKVVTLAQHEKSIYKYLSDNPILKRRVAAGHISVKSLALKFFKS